MNKKFKSIIQIMHVQKKLLELELQIGEGIPLEQLETSVKSVDMLFEDKTNLNEVSCAMDFLEISKERFKEIMRALVNSGEIKITVENDVVRVGWEEQIRKRKTKEERRKTKEGRRKKDERSEKKEERRKQKEERRKKKGEGGRKKKNKTEEQAALLATAARGTLRSNRAISVKLYQLKKRSERQAPGVPVQQV